MGRFRSDRLVELRTARGLSQDQLAKLAGSTQPSINRLEAGETERPRNLPELARALGTTTDYLLGETDDPGSRLTDRRLPWRSAEPDPQRDPDLVEIDQIDMRFGMGATYVDGPVDTEKRVFSRSWLRNFTRAAPEQLFWTLGDGDSMEPTIRSGEVILIDRSQTSLRSADAIWAVTVGDIAQVKRLRPRASGAVEILSDNPAVPPDVAVDGELHIIGRVVAVVRRL